jgi:hypothetical protein
MDAFALNTEPDWQPKRLAANAGIAFAGVSIKDAGFKISESDCLYEINKWPVRYLLTSETISPPKYNEYVELIHENCILDFDNKSLEYCQNRHPSVLKFIEKHTDNDREKWWQLPEPCMELKKKLKGLSYFIATPRYSGQPLPVFIRIDNRNRNIIPDDSVVVFTWKDWEHLGVLESIFYRVWFEYYLEHYPNNYDPIEIFETFPFPLEISRSIGFNGEYIWNRAVSDYLDIMYNDIWVRDDKFLNEIKNKLNKETAKCYGFTLKNLDNKEKILEFLLKENKKRHLE